MKKISIELTTAEAKVIERLLVVAMNLCHVFAAQVKMYEMLSGIKQRIEEELLKQ